MGRALEAGHGAWEVGERKGKQLGSRHENGLNDNTQPKKIGKSHYPPSILDQSLKTCYTYFNLFSSANYFMFIHILLNINTQASARMAAWSQFS